MFHGAKPGLASTIFNLSETQPLFTSTNTVVDTWIMHDAIPAILLSAVYTVPFDWLLMPTSIEPHPDHFSSTHSKAQTEGLHE